MIKWLLTILIKCFFLLLPHRGVVTVRQGEQDFNKGGEVDVYLCACLCAHCLHANEMCPHDPALV